MTRQDLSTSFHASDGQKSGLLSGQRSARPKRRALPADWSIHDDNALRDTKGRYAKIAALSDRFGIETGALMARWHLLRAGRVTVRAVPPETAAGPAPSLVVEPLTFKSMRMKVTPRMRDILDRVGPGEEGNSLDLASELDIDSEHVLRAIDRNRAKMARAGWVIRLRSLHKAGTQLTLEKLA